MADDTDHIVSTNYWGSASWWEKRERGQERKTGVTREERWILATESIYLYLVLAHRSFMTYPIVMELEKRLHDKSSKTEMIISECLKGCNANGTFREEEQRRVNKTDVHLVGESPLYISFSLLNFTCHLSSA
jgi:hypothetical protein